MPFSTVLVQKILNVGPEDFEAAHHSRVWTRQRGRNARHGADIHARRHRGPAGAGRGRRAPWPAGLLGRRPSRYGRPGGTGAGPCGDRQLRLRFSPAADRRQPGPGQPAQGRSRSRPADRGGAAGGIRSARLGASAASRDGRRAGAGRHSARDSGSARDCRGGPRAGRRGTRRSSRERSRGGAGRRESRCCRSIT